MYYRRNTVAQTTEEIIGGRDKMLLQNSRYDKGKTMTQTGTKKQEIQSFSRFAVDDRMKKSAKCTKKCLVI